MNLVDVYKFILEKKREQEFFIYQKIKIKNEFEYCSICLCKDDKDFIILKCKHIFHSICINNLNINQCPLCRCVLKKKNKNIIFKFHYQICYISDIFIIIFLKNNNKQILYEIKQIMIEIYNKNEYILYAIDFKVELNKLSKHMLHFFIIDKKCCHFLDVLNNQQYFFRYNDKLDQMFHNCLTFKKIIKSTKKFKIILNPNLLQTENYFINQSPILKDIRKIFL